MKEGAVGREDLRFVQSGVGDRHRGRKGDGQHRRRLVIWGRPGRTAGVGFHGGRRHSDPVLSKDPADRPRRDPRVRHLMSLFLGGNDEA